MSAPMRRWSCIKSGLKVIAAQRSHRRAARRQTARHPGADAPCAQHGSIAGFSEAELHFDPDELLTLPCDVLVPAAMERVITAQVAANSQMPHSGRRRQRPDHAGRRPHADKRRNEIFVIPDILCNAGGVVVSYFEWVQDLQQFLWNETK